MPITLVWIDEGCINCGACPMIAPLVFTIPDDDAEAYILGSSRADGRTGPNRVEQSVLLPVIVLLESESIREAAEGCPVEVIRYLAA